jgi:hypothetical protein
MKELFFMILIAALNSSVAHAQAISGFYSFHGATQLDLEAPFTRDRIVRCPENTYAYGVRTWTAPAEVGYCVNCIAGLQLMCAPAGAKPGESVELSMSAVSGNTLPVYGRHWYEKKFELLRPNQGQDLACPQGSYLSGIQGYGAPPSVKFCINCLAQIQITCTNLSDGASFESRVEAIPDQEVYKKSECEKGQPVDELGTFFAFTATRYCIGCLTGLKVSCKSSPVALVRQVVKTANRVPVLRYEARETLSDDSVQFKAPEVLVQASDVMPMSIHGNSLMAFCLAHGMLPVTFEMTSWRDRRNVAEVDIKGGTENALKFNQVGENAVVELKVQQEFTAVKSVTCRKP